jgi:hypothetical protein
MRTRLLVLVATSAAFLGCGPAAAPRSPARPAPAAQWLERAKASYRAADFDDAHDASSQALALVPKDSEIREMAAKIALVRLDFADAIRLTEGLEGSSARAIRGRAFWFAGDVEHAADELEAVLADPAVKDPWAREVAGLARRGSGRRPFEMDGGLVASVEMPRALEKVSLGAASVVPCELDGERVLALIATGSSEVLIDSTSRREASWVSLRFDRVEIRDVPALVQDLSPISRQLGVPVKVMLGTQLLRHAHVTVDRRGDQFVVRRHDAGTPPEASRVPLYYVRGGGMVVRATFSSHEDDYIPLLVDTSRQFPLFLEDATWKKAGVDVHSLTPVAGASGNVRQGTVPMFRLGGFDLPKLPGVAGVDLKEVTQGLDIDLGGIVGADLLAFFRVTLADEGRFMWVEPDPTLLAPAAMPPSGEPLSQGAPAASEPPPRRSPPADSAPPASGMSPAIRGPRTP